MVTNRKLLNHNVAVCKNERYTAPTHKKEIQKDLSHLLDLRVSWVSAAAPDLRPPLIKVNPRPDGLKTCRGQRDTEVMSLLQSAE